VSHRDSCARSDKILQHSKLFEWHCILFPLLLEKYKISHESLSLCTFLLFQMLSLISQHTSELGVGNTRPFSTTVPYTCAPHHVTHVMLFIPLVSNTIHDSFIGCADFLMSCLEMYKKYIRSQGPNGFKCNILPVQLGYLKSSHL
jgi:hypothetical protein